MSDLIPRLRERHSFLCDEAAAELDRLNAQALELCAEISRLTRERDLADSMLHSLQTRWANRATEQELRELLRTWRRHFNTKAWQDAVDAALAGAADQPDGATERTGIEFLHLWMRTPNPMLGNVSPLDMMDSGRGEKLADFIRDAAEADGITIPTPVEAGTFEILHIYDMPDGTKERIVKERKERYRETSNDGLHWSRCL